ncbi:hypothetical protein [Lentilactobacillus sunkii]|uniref:hypothetical protein n=1 Tax=Lentilactobacillus sunkii TaxID=481719 RepID=UPI00114CF104|nr:hypothetical protein [Lentilactobacillus sunkii]
MNKITKWIISLLGIRLVSAFSNSTTNASETNDGILTPIQDKYWSATVSTNPSINRTTTGVIRPLAFLK